MVKDRTSETVLVTGGSGRLGRSVVDRLRETYGRVVSVDVAGRSDLDTDDRFPADLLDAGAAYAAFARYEPDALVQLAAIAEPFSQPEQAIVKTNVTIAYNVLQAAVDFKIGKIVVASSPTVMGYDRSTWVPDYLPLDENHPVAPGHGYSVSKYMTEEIVRSFVRQAGDRTRFAMFRPSFVVAPEEWQGQPIQGGGTIAERLDDLQAAGSNLFNYIDARDAASLVELLLEKIDQIPNGEVYFGMAPDAFAHEPIAGLLPSVHPGISVEAAAGLTGTSPSIDSSKAMELGWDPVHTWRRELKM